MSSFRSRLGKHRRRWGPWRRRVLVVLLFVLMAGRVMARPPIMGKTAVLIQVSRVDDPAVRLEIKQNVLLGNISSEQELHRAINRYLWDSRGKHTHPLLNEWGMELVYIPAGSFTMGSSEGYRDETPVHDVIIPDGFYLGKYEVTQEQWVAVMGYNNSYFIGNDLPVEKVAWLEIKEFLKRLNDREDGKGTYSLPSEQEWEYACRAGTGTRYFWGDVFDGTRAWCRENSGEQTHPVGTAAPNKWGLHDMAGNVSEWCGTMYCAYPGSDWEPVQDERPTPVVRGGHWRSSPGSLRSANRSRLWEHYRLSFTGFRLKYTVKP